MQMTAFDQPKHMLRCPSVPMYHETNKYGTSSTINTSTSSIESVDDEYRKMAIKWLLQFDRKVTKDTNYLSVWYLEQIIKNGLIIKESNWQLIAASTILFASKMNQIYPPSINSIIKRCKAKYINVTKESVIEMEGKILNMLNFNIAIQSPYNLINQMLNDNKRDIEECEKLLKIMIYHKDINQQQSELLAYAIIYLISRNTVDGELQGEHRQRVKLCAQKIYTYYKDMRRAYEKQRTLCDFRVTKNQRKQNPIIRDQLQVRVEQKKGQLQRAGSWKVLGKALKESTNITKQTLHNCLSRDQLRDGYRHKYQTGL